METDAICARIAELSRSFAAARRERQGRTALSPQDFADLSQAGLPLLAVPRAHGGAFEGLGPSLRPLCAALRTLAQGDGSVALVCAMHPAVLSYWLAEHPVAPAERPPWERQRAALFQAARGGAFFGTITSEPGSGGDIARTRAAARRDGQTGSYLLDGQKHFGSGLGVTSFMVTTAVPEGEALPDWFLLDVRGVPWDGSRGMELLAPWDGFGMKATQSHGVRFQGFPAERIAWPGHRQEISDATGPFIGCLFAAVALGVVDAALALARAQRAQPAGAYEAVEWERAELEGWLAAQALEGMLRAAVGGAPGAAREVLQGKVAISELAESCLQRLCRIGGGGSFSQRSPLGHLLQDVRALGFLRPPWGLAFATLVAGSR